jgi:hypothetical protein
VMVALGAVGVDEILPAAVTDWSVNSLPDGTGTDLTASFGVSWVALDRMRRVITVTNSGATPGYLTRLQVRGALVAEGFEETQSAGAGSDLFTLDLAWTHNGWSAASFAAYLANALTKDSEYPVIELEADWEKQFGLDLLSVVYLNVDVEGVTIDNLFFVGKIEHTAIARDIVRTRVWLEPIYVWIGSYMNWAIFGVPFSKFVFGI